jgi:hypothetical protein
MQSEKNIQISQLLFNQMAIFCLEESARTPELEEQIKKGIYDKLDRQINHELYSKYKTAPTEEQKEKARLEYLDRVGIHKDFRW